VPGDVNATATSSCTISRWAHRDRERQLTSVLGDLGSCAGARATAALVVFISAATNPSFSA
jgi:hypothetical protein